MRETKFPDNGFMFSKEYKAYSNPSDIFIMESVTRIENNELTKF